MSRRSSPASAIGSPVSRACASSRKTFDSAGTFSLTYINALIRFSSSRAIFITTAAHPTRAAPTVYAILIDRATVVATKLRSIGAITRFYECPEANLRSRATFALTSDANLTVGSIAARVAALDLAVWHRAAAVWNTSERDVDTSLCRKTSCRDSTLVARKAFCWVVTYAFTTVESDFLASTFDLIAAAGVPATRQAHPAFAACTFGATFHCPYFGSNDFGKARRIAWPVINASHQAIMKRVLSILVAGVCGSTVARAGRRITVVATRLYIDSEPAGCGGIVRIGGRGISFLHLRYRRVQ